MERLRRITKDEIALPGTSLLYGLQHTGYDTIFYWFRSIRELYPEMSRIEDGRDTDCDPSSDIGKRDRRVHIVTKHLHVVV